VQRRLIVESEKQNIMMNINNVTQIVQKYRQAPWRVQRQWIGLFLLGLVLVAMVAGIYVNLTTRADLAGREIQNINNDILDNQRKNADFETQLASLTSDASMMQRAEKLGFQPVSPDELTYVVVPGFVARPPIDLSSTTRAPTSPVILPEYTESLFDWFSREIGATVPSGGQP
jgi:cell division protein FtsL